LKHGSSIEVAQSLHTNSKDEALVVQVSIGTDRLRTQQSLRVKLVLET